MAYAVDDSASLANTARAVGLPSRSCSSWSVCSGRTEHFCFRRYAAGSRDLGGRLGRQRPEGSESREPASTSCVESNPGSGSRSRQDRTTAARIASRSARVARIPSSGSAPVASAPSLGVGPSTVGDRRSALLRRARPAHLGRPSPLILVVLVVGAAIVGGVARRRIVTRGGGGVTLNLAVPPPVRRTRHRSTSRTAPSSSCSSSSRCWSVSWSRASCIGAREVHEASEQVRAPRPARRPAPRRAQPPRRERASPRRGARELDQQRSALLRSVSHDLRTPLATIRAVATDLRDGDEYDDATRVELLDLVCDEVDRLDRFVANLLSLSRIEAGAFAPERQAVDLPELVDRRASAAWRRLLARGHRPDRRARRPAPGRRRLRPARAGRHEPARERRPPQRRAGSDVVDRGGPRRPTPCASRSSDRGTRDRARGRRAHCSSRSSAATAAVGRASGSPSAGDRRGPRWHDLGATHVRRRRDRSRSPSPSDASERT